MNSTEKNIITHSGRFHADEVFGVAALLTVYPDAKIIRTRDPEVIKTGDIVLDVGGIHDESKDLFDHHQIGGAGKHENGIPYASFGLVWKKYGVHIVGSPEVAVIIEKYLVMPIDAGDNGFDITAPVTSGVDPFLIQDLMFLFVPTWNEKTRTFDQGFFEVLDIARKVLLRSIIRARADVLGIDNVRKAYEDAKDKRLLVLSERYHYKEVVYNHLETLYVVLPDSQPGKWKIQAIEENSGTFKLRKKLPEEWAGKKDKELQNVTGVSDAVFCHTGRFIAVAGSKEGALKLAELALKA